MPEYLNVTQPSDTDLVFQVVALIVQVLAILAAAGIVVWQVRVQFKQNRDLQKSTAREELNLRIYEEINEMSRALSLASIKVTGFVRDVEMNIGWAKASWYPGVPAWLKDVRTTEFLALEDSLNDSIHDIMHMLEKWEVVKPELKIFQTALNVVSHKCRPLFNELHKKYLTILPIDVPNEGPGATGDKGTKVHFHALPDDLTQLELERLTKEFSQECNKYGEITYDLNVETQNTLLGNLFEHRVAMREPLDPNIWVVTTREPDRTRLEEFFENETDWGQHNKEVMENVRQENAKKGI